MTIMIKLMDLEEYHKRWTDFRVNCEALEHERFMYLTRTGEYDGDEDEAFEKFVDRIESIINNEVQQWKKKNNQKQQQQGQQQGAQDQQGGTQEGSSGDNSSESSSESTDDSGSSDESSEDDGKPQK